MSGPDLWAALQDARRRVDELSERVVRLETRQAIVWAIGAAVAGLVATQFKQVLGL